MIEHKQKNKKSIGVRFIRFILIMLCITASCIGIVSFIHLEQMKKSSALVNKKLGSTAANRSLNSLEDIAGDQLLSTAKEKSDLINLHFQEIISYVHGIADQSEMIYANEGGYYNQIIPGPQEGNTELAVQLLFSKKLKQPKEYQIDEVEKLGNISNLLYEYAANNSMVASTYVATTSGWMLQADSISYTKFIEGTDTPAYYEASQRQWYTKALNQPKGQAVYSDILKDINGRGDCIVCSQPIYRGNEIVAVAGVGSYLQNVEDVVLNTNIGTSGYAFLLNENGEILASPMTKGEIVHNTEKHTDLRTSANTPLANVANDMVEQKSGIHKITLDGKEVYIAFAPLKSMKWSFATVQSIKDVTAPAQKSHKEILKIANASQKEQNGAIKRSIRIYIVLLFLLSGIILSISVALVRKITQPIQVLTQGVLEIGNGNLDKKVHIQTGDEIEVLAEAFNEMTTRMKEYISNIAKATAEKEKIRTELQVASKLQLDMLPATFNVFSHVREAEIAALMRPAKEVGGDFYDYFMIDKNHLAILVADVSGKGVPAALFMVKAKTLIQNSLSVEEPIEKSIERVNNALCKNNQDGMFVTAWIGILELSTGKVVYVNAGHTKTLLQKRGSKFEYLTSVSGFVLAGMEDMRYRPYEFTLFPGNKIILYSDGVTEANDDHKDFYGEERLITCVDECRNQKPQEVCQSIWNGINEFQKDEEQFDDITVFVLEYRYNEYENEK